MLQRLIRAIGWGFYCVGLWAIMQFTIEGAVFADFGDALFLLGLCILPFIIGRAIIYVAVGPRRNPF